MKNTSIGDRIEEIRLTEALTRQTFAEKIGVTQEYVRMMENGKRIPREPIMLAICYRFDVREKWLETGAGKRRG